MHVSLTWSIGDPDLWVSRHESHFRKHFHFSVQLVPKLVWFVRVEVESGVVFRVREVLFYQRTLDCQLWSIVRVFRQMSIILTTESVRWQRLDVSHKLALLKIEFSLLILQIMVLNINFLLFFVSFVLN